MQSILIENDYQLKWYLFPLGNTSKITQLKFTKSFHGRTFHQIVIISQPDPKYAIPPPRF
jgi:acetylornithine/succinyldiaminopimelate/putrescine aminotransferase